MARFWVAWRGLRFARVGCLVGDRHPGHVPRARRDDLGSFPSRQAWCLGSPSDSETCTLIPGILRYKYTILPMHSPPISELDTTTNMLIEQSTYNNRQETQASNPRGGIYGALPCPCRDPILIRGYHPPTRSSVSFPSTTPYSQKTRPKAPCGTCTETHTGVFQSPPAHPVNAADASDRADLSLYPVVLVGPSQPCLNAQLASAKKPTQTSAPKSHIIEIPHASPNIL